MPRPRKMQTAAVSDRAIVLKATPCPCGCGVSGPCEITMLTPEEYQSQRESETLRLALAAHITPRIAREAIEQGVITEFILDGVQERRLLMAITDKDVKDLVKLAQGQGFTVTEDGSNLRWTNPEGGTVITPNRVVGRGLQNVKAQLRRLGLDIPRTGKGSPRASETETTTDVVESSPELESTDKPVISEEISQAYAALATLTEFVAGHQHDDDEGEWQSICEGLEAELTLLKAELERVTQERDEALHKIQTLRELFK